MSGSRRLWARYHPAVWWILLIKALFGLAFMLLVPPYRGPDESRHVDMIIWHQSSPGYQDPTEHTPVDPGVVASERLASPPGRPRPPQRAADATPRAERLPFDELDAPVLDPAPGNQMSQHPPLFYLTAAGAYSVVSELPAEPWSWDQEVFFYRLVSWLTFATLPLLAAEVALALGLARAFTAVAASVTLLVPMSSFIGAVVSNDGLAVTFVGLAVVGALAYLHRGGTRWAAVTAVGCAGAPLTKSTAAPAVAWAVLVVVIAVVRRSGWRPSRAALRHLAVVGVGTVVGFSWHIANVVRFADPQPNGFDRAGGPGHDGSIVDYLGVWIPRVASTFWGQPARRTGVTLAPWMITILTVVAIGLCIYAIVRARRHWLPTGLLTVLVLGQVALMFRSNWNAHLRSGRYPALQGRYLFALLVPMAALITIAVAARLDRSQQRRAVGVAAVLGAVGVGLHLVLGWSMLTGGYWADDGEGVPGQLGAVMAWSPLSPGVTATVFVATGIAVVLAAVFFAMGDRAGTAARSDAVSVAGAVGGR